MKTKNIHTEFQQNNLENVVISSPKRFERSPQIKFFRKQADRNVIGSNVQAGAKTDIYNKYSRNSVRGSDVGSFMSNPQDIKQRLLQQSNSAKALLMTGNSHKQYLTNHNANDNIGKQYERELESPGYRKTFNIGKVKQEDERVLVALKQEIQRKKKAIQAIQAMNESNQQQSNNKYKKLQNQYQNALEKIKKLEQSHNDKKPKNNKSSSSQIKHQLAEKNAKLQKDILELQEKYAKKIQQCKYHEIEIGMLRKRKDQMKNSQYKLLKLTQKNKQLTKKVEGFKKQLTQVNSCKNLHGNNFKKRKDSNDSLFDLSSDHSVDRHYSKLY